MENAAKALLIAGGVLIAIMVLTVLVYAITAKNRIEKAEYEKAQVEKLAKFNSEFEAYNKNRLYGMDVISVINKAIAYNRRMQASKTEDKYFINIKFVTSQTFKNELYKIDNTSADRTEIQIKTESEKDQEDAKLTNSADKSKLQDLWNIVTIDPIMGTEDESNPKEYELGNVSDDGKNFAANIDVTKMFSGNSMNDIIYTTSDGKATYKLYSALTNFKRAVFACTKSNYDSSKNGLANEKSNGATYKDGAISELRFVQIKTNRN